MKKIILVLTVFSLSVLPFFSQDIPKLKGHVNDYAGVLSPSEEREMEQMLIDLEKSTSAQVALLTVNNLQGFPLESFSFKTAEEWGLGQKDRDNGLLILMAMEEKKVRIEVGYGLEGDMTDIKSGYIIRNIIIPQFRKGNFGKGLYEGTAVISGIIAKTSDISEEELSKYSNNSRRTSSGGGISINFIVFIIIFIFSSIFRGRRRGRGGLFNALFLGSLMSGSRHRGGGFGGGSGFGGGGFSGGGGGFGGGGASGGW